MSEHDTHATQGAWQGMHGGHGGWHGAPPGLKALRIAGMVVLGVIAAALFALAFGWLVMILWNWLMPLVFHLGVVTYWQAFGIVILAKLLFGGIGAPHGGRGRSPWKGRRWGGGPWEGEHGEKHGREEWKWHREFWEQEGRPAYERFMERKRAESQAGSGPGSEPPRQA